MNIVSITALLVVATLSGVSTFLFFDAAQRELAGGRIGLTIRWGALSLVMFATCLICARIVLKAAIGLN